MLSFGEKIAKIGPADPEIICLREIILKKMRKKKKLRKVKYIARLAGLPSGLNKQEIYFFFHSQHVTYIYVATYVNCNIRTVHPPTKNEKS